MCGLRILLARRKTLDTDNFTQHVKSTAFSPSKNYTLSKDYVAVGDAGSCVHVTMVVASVRYGG